MVACGLDRLVILLLSAMVLGAISAARAQDRGPTAAVLEGGLPGDNPRLRTSVISELIGAGYDVVGLSVDSLCDTAPTAP